MPLPKQQEQQSCSTKLVVLVALQLQAPRLLQQIWRAAREPGT
jgi:hypothetical protein